MKRRTQILVLILVSTTLIYGLSVGYIGLYTQRQAIADAKEITSNQAAEYANKIRAQLEHDLGLVRALASSMKSVRGGDIMQEMKVYNRTLRDVFIHNNYLSVANSWELNAFKQGYTKTHGRIRSEYYEFGGDIIQETDSMDMERDNVNGLYYQIKLQNKEAITPPYWYRVDERADEQLVTTVAAPITVDGEFAGLAGVDRSLQSFQDTLSRIRPYDKSYAFLLSHKGSFIAHPNSDYLGKLFSEVQPEINEEYGVEQLVRRGRQFAFMVKDKKGREDRFVAYAPFKIGNTGKTWALAIAVPYDVIVKDANANLTTALIIGIIGLLLLTVLFLFVSQRIAALLVDVAGRLASLARGKIEETNKMKVITEGDELGQIKMSVNQLIDGLSKTVTFAVNIGKGNLEADYEKLSNEDAFGDALLNMRDNLRQVREEEKRREEENRKRNWIAEGIAKMNDTLRIYRNKETGEFASQIVSNIVDYLETNQAGLFFVESNGEENGQASEDNAIIELKAAYAYNRRKLFDKQIKPGVGLVGRSVKEKRTIYLTEVPDHYLEITSGVGNSTPGNILIVPLISEDYVFGVIEMASFREFKEHERQFISRVSEIIASAIATQRYSARTTELLRESNKKSDELARQEQEMRTNLSELRAAQEESQRAEQEMKGIVDAITSTSSIVHLDPNGKIQKVMSSKNKNSRVYGKNSTGNFISELDISAIEDAEAYEELWKELRKGTVREKILHIDIHEDNRWINEVYTPITDANGRIERIIIIQTDITERKQQENRLKQQASTLKQKEEKLKSSVESLGKSQKELRDKNRYIEKINDVVDRSLLRAEFTPEGIITFSNDNFARAIGWEVHELKNKSLFDLAELDAANDIESIRKQLFSGVTYHGEFKFTFENGGEVWFLSTFSPGFDKFNNVVKVFFLGYNITESKKMQLRVREQSAKLKEKDKKLQQQLAEMKQSQQLILQKNARIRSITEALDKSFLRAEYTMGGKVAQSNFNFLNILGYKASEILDTTVSNLLADSSRKKHKELTDEVFKRKVVQEEIEMLDKGGYSVWLLYTLAPQEDNNGNLNGMVFIGYDISSIKEMQKEIEFQNKELKAQEEAMREHLEALHVDKNELEAELERKENELKKRRKRK